MGMSEQLSDDQRKDVYWSLLRGIGRECQNRLCAEDKSLNDHDWGPWTRYRVEHDFVPSGPLGWNEPIPDMAIHIRSERHCLNCGKEQHC
jgi:hypothetical protein